MVINKKALFVFFSAAFISNIGYAKCIISDAQLSITPSEVISGQSTSVIYTADRSGCSGTGTYSHKVFVGSSSGVQIGVCEGTRTLTRETCEGYAAIPNGFVGDLNVYVNGKISKLSVLAPLPKPIAQNYSVETTEDEQVVIELAPAGDPYPKYEITAQPTDEHGSAVVNGSTIVFTPASNWNGKTSFFYRATDVNGIQSDLGEIEVTVAAAPDAPILIQTALIGLEDQAISFEPLVVDKDAGDAYRLYVDTQPDPAFGHVTIDGDKVIFTPAPDWHGSVDISLLAIDSIGQQSEPQFYSITIENQNDAPVVTPIQRNTAEDNSVTEQIVFNDVDGLAPFAYFISEQPEDGGVCSIYGSEVTFHPKENWHGYAVCEVSVADAGGAVGHAQFAFDVGAANDAPTAMDKHVTLNQGESTTIQIEITDPDAEDSHTIVLVDTDDPGFGSITASTASIAIAPATTFYGKKKISYKVVDSASAESETAYIYLKVLPVNGVPALQGQEFTTGKDTPLTIRIAGIDPNRDSPLTYQVATQVNPAQGSVAIVGDNLTFTPATGFIGTAQASITVRDPGGLTSVPAIFKFDVVDALVVGVDPDIPDTHTVVIVEQPPSEVGVVSSTGNRVTLTPKQGYYGTSSFKYKVVDSVGAESSVVTGTISVAKFNYAPTSATASISVFEGETSHPVSPTVVDPNVYDDGKHTFIVPIQATNGFVEIVNNKIIYTARDGFIGSETFKFIAVDEGGLSVVGTATVNVTPKNYAPTLVSAVSVAPEGVTQTANIKVVDRNPADTFTFEILEQPHSGTASIQGGNIEFIPSAGFVGNVLVPIKATDQGGLAVTGFAVFTVEKQNFAPTSLAGDISVYENGVSALYYPSITDANLYDYGRHKIELVHQASNGIAEIVDNHIKYTPSPNYSGPDQITIKGTDLGGESVEGVIVITVMPLNTSPLRATVAIYTREGEDSLPTLPEVEDLNAWDSHTLEVVSQPTHGSVIVTEEGFVYTPDVKYYGTDEFIFRAVDTGGEFVEGVASVVVYKKNMDPTGFTPTETRFFEGVGASFRLEPIDQNIWGSHTFSVAQQPEHGHVTFRGNVLTYRTTGVDPAVVMVTVTDQGGLTFTGPLALTPRPIGDLIDGLPEVDLSVGAIKTPASKKAFTRADGKPGFLITDADALDALGTDLVVVVDGVSEVGLTISGTELSPGKGTRMVIDHLAPGGLGTSIAAIEDAKAGESFVKVARIDGTGSVYRIPVSVWSPGATVAVSPNPAIQLIDRVKGELTATDFTCDFKVSSVEASKGNAYDNPYCLVEFTKRPEEAKDISSDSTLAFQGPIEIAGIHEVEASSYIVDANGDKHLVGRYSTQIVVNPVAGSIELEPKYPFTNAYYKVEDLDIDLRQSAGPACDLTVVEFRAQNAAKNYSTRPVCLVEWDEIPIGLTARPNWEKPYIMGIPQFLGDNELKWRISIYSPKGNKVEVGTGNFQFTTVMPPAVDVTYLDNTNKLTEGLFKSDLNGQYVTDAEIYSAGALLNLKHNFNNGQFLEEQVLPGFMRSQVTSRRIYTAPFNSLWERRNISIEAAYSDLPELKSDSSLEVVSVPGQSILPILDSLNEKVLSTEMLRVEVKIGDAYNNALPYNPLTMGEWEIRLVTKPSWNSIEPVTDWLQSDADGKAVFDLALTELAGKNIRLFAQAKAISPIPEYQETRMSPMPLSVAVLNGAALDGTIRALRVTGEAPLRVTLFADVDNRAWTRDLGAVRWEVSTEGGTWEEVVNTSKSQQRLAKTFDKGNYRVRAHLTNKNSGAVSTTDEIEIIAFNVPKGILKGPGNAFLDSTASFKVLQVDGSPLDMTNIDIEWSLDRGVTWMPGTDQFAITKATEQRVYVYARMKYKDAPITDSRIWKVIRGGVAFRKVRPPRVQLIGPKRPEVGKEATWVANMLLPYPNMDLTMGGEFIMPHDGSIVAGTEAKYTPTEDDLALEMTEISYRAWIDGYRDKGGEGLTTQRITFWFYDWPDWAIQPTFSSDYAPADLTLRVRNVGEFKGVEGVFYDWEIPVDPGIDIIKDDNMALRILQINEPDTYTFKVHVFDARGNYSLVERPMLFKEPPPWEVSLSWSGDNTAHRAPMDVLVRPYISGGHPKDSITSLVYRLNGEVLSTGGSRYARATLPDEGTYRVDLDIETVMGKQAAGNVQIAVQDNVAPTCELQVKEGGTAWTANAKCTDTDGRIARHHWYLGETLQGLGGSVITISKRTYTEPPRITLIAVDDSGEESPPVMW